LERFKEAFARYLGLEGSSEPLHRYKADEMGTSAGFQTATPDPDVAVGKCEKANDDGLCSGVADRKGDQGQEDDICPNVTFLGIEPFEPCAHCGKADGVVHHVRDNRHLNRASTSLHEQCVAGWFARQEQEDIGKGDGGDGSGDAICDYCGRPGDLVEVFFGDGLTARLHRGCEEPYRHRLDDA